MAQNPTENRESTSRHRRKSHFMYGSADLSGSIQRPYVSFHRGFQFSLRSVESRIGLPEKRRQRCQLPTSASALGTTKRESVASGPSDGFVQATRGRGAISTALVTMQDLRLHTPNEV